MSPFDFVLDVAQRLAEAGIAFMVVGSLGSSFHSQPRTTLDVDLVIDPGDVAQLDRFLDSLGDSYYASREAAREAWRLRSMFNIIHLDSGWKADLILRKDRPFSVEEFRRRQTVSLQGASLDIVSVEDAILSKLEWHAITPSERQMRDVVEMVAAKASLLDREYLRRWADALGVRVSLEAVLHTVEKHLPG